MFQPIGKIREILCTVFALVRTCSGVHVRVLLQFRAAQKRFAAMRANVRSLLEMHEAVHLEVAFGLVHLRTGLTLEGTHTDVILAMAK